MESDHHIPRYSAISIPLNVGAEPFSVQKLADHSDVRLTTQTYAQVQQEALRRAVGVFDGISLTGKADANVDLAQKTVV